MPYTQTTFAQLKQQLANRLDDPLKNFWIDSELGLLLQDAIRFWNILTGEYRQWFDLEVFNAGGYGVGGYGFGGYGTGVMGVWYDLQKIAGSPRLSTLTDVDVYTRIQLALLEPAIANCVMTTNQFSTDDVVAAVQEMRDEFLFRTFCTSSVDVLNVNPDVETVQLSERVIAVKRAYWLPTPQASPVYPNPLPRTDEAQQMGYDSLSPVTNSTDPYAHSAGVEPPLQIRLYPPPGFPGQVELITYESQGALDPTVPTTLLMPNDFMPAIKWGALANLLDMNSVARDVHRAEYARMRYEQYVELMSHYPFILAARNLGIPTPVDAVEVLDAYTPDWRLISDNPAVVGISGQNLLAFPTANDQLLSLFIVANANVPVLDNDPVQLGDEILSAILDYAEHDAMFKQGTSEVQSSMKLLRSIMDLAGRRNYKLKALSSYKQIMYGISQRENQLDPQEFEEVDNG